MMVVGKKLILVLFEFVDPLLCGRWMVHGKRNGLEFPTL